ncbi:MAG: hypothetical protein HKP52_07465 [Desulfofustis sp.]|nr:hypothetical protein [Desulfofustis sp.]MBT8347184.1 hypothetical protein [Desulfofustis sp.]MBT8355722.1 hypothetical protein [Desulfofustis sp.]NNK14059.1 hypothetical protein [Desulfofustis sp.]NNK57079.1 hypothetical protein [Desulfofustis sp.]
MDSQSAASKENVRILLFSFGFKHGVPVDANLLFDVRFLPNPYWQEDLRPKSGLQEEVSSYVVGSDQGRDFLELLEPLLLLVAAGMVRNKRDLRIGIGCTGGRHRSVAVVEALTHKLSVGSDFQVRASHRDIDKDAS